MKDLSDNYTDDLFPKRLKTSAERQATYRAKNKDKSRINCLISKESKAKLDEMRGSLSIEQMLEKLINEEYREFEDNPTLKLSPSEQRKEKRKTEKEDIDFYENIETEEERIARIREACKPKLRPHFKKRQKINQETGKD